MTTDPARTTLLVQSLGRGEPGAADELLPLVYRELRQMAESFFRGQKPSHTLQPTALVHEAFLKLVDQTSVEFNDRAHFCAVAATAMRQILIDHVTIDEPGAAEGLAALDVLALDEALSRLGEIDRRQARVVEMRFFGGLSVQETARALGVSDRTVELDWRMAKAWLSRALSDGRA
jgi:RNA polymerase sigma factor (sigma-70 family)